MIAVFTVTDGADGEDDADIWTPLSQRTDSTAEVVGTGIDGQLFFREQTGRTFLAVVYNLARLLKTVDVVGA